MLDINQSVQCRIVSHKGFLTSNCIGSSMNLKKDYLGKAAIERRFKNFKI